MKKLLLIGISGRMGQEIESLAHDAGFEIAGGVSSQAAISNSRHVVSRIEDFDPSNVDVAVDFSSPALSPAVIAYCVKHRLPLVSGVTGIDDSVKGAFVKAGVSIPILWSPNMSIGVAVLARLLSNLSKLDGFDFQIEELHHARKKDRPSGTALMLQEQLSKVVKSPLPEPVSIRGGGIFGIHRIWAMGEEEMLSLEHTAMNRRVFARGALKAASWLISRPPGLYKMDDVLNT